MKLFREVSYKTNKPQKKIQKLNMSTAVPESNFRKCSLAHHVYDVFKLLGCLNNRRNICRKFYKNPREENRGTIWR